MCKALVSVVTMALQEIPVYANCMRSSASLLAFLNPCEAYLRSLEVTWLLPCIYVSILFHFLFFHTFYIFFLFLFFFSKSFLIFYWKPKAGLPQNHSSPETSAQHWGSLQQKDKVIPTLKCFVVLGAFEADPATLIHTSSPCCPYISKS